ncbi:hypothetical protein LJC58_07655 [Lachnospiraceae bacterium OttesenSCG-928-D06]|nr:hypothetical protein [Lachnospiraceae bacterium OttesenSCG-928-D06]
MIKVTIYDGNEIYRIRFSKYDQNKNGIYDDDDEYLFDEVNVIKEQWEAAVGRAPNGWNDATNSYSRENTYNEAITHFQ